MITSLAQLIALVSYGNEFLNSGELIDGFYTDNSTFKFCEAINYIEPEYFLGLKLKDKIIAKNPHQWFENLKSENCKKLRLAYLSSYDQSLEPDYQTAGFVGGGGTWKIEAVYDVYSKFFEPRWIVSNANAKDNKIWRVNYKASKKNKSQKNVKYDLSDLKAKLGATLKEITNFAFENDLGYWADWFNKANVSLQSDFPEQDCYHKDFIIRDNYPLPNRQLLFSAALAWAFGGMGSWNDIGFESKEINDRYSDLSNKLYYSIITSILAAINC